MSPGRRARPGRGWLVLLAGLGIALAAGVGAAENPGAELAAALRSLGASGLLWGRLAVEEESPDGAWTPLNDVDVRLYPAVPSLLAALERIRESSRASGSQYQTAVTRLQEALAAYEAQVKAATRGTVAPEASGETKGWQRATDPAGLFVFDDLPSGEWLLVAIRVTPYRVGPAPTRPDSRRRAAGREPRFLPKTGEPPQEAEVWLSRVRLAPGERVSVVFTDRARWLVGPTR